MLNCKSKKSWVRTLVVLLCPLVFLSVAACGGGKKTPPPQSTNDQFPVPPEDLASLDRAANQAQSSCGSAYAPFFVQAAMFSQQPQGNQMMQNMPLPGGNQCKDDLLNFMLIGSTLGNGTWSQQTTSRNWMEGVLLQMGDGIGNVMMAHGIMPTPDLKLRLSVAFMRVHQDMMAKMRSSQLPPSLMADIQSASSAAIR